MVAVPAYGLKRRPLDLGTTHTAQAVSKSSPLACPQPRHRPARGSMGGFRGRVKPSEGVCIEAPDLVAALELALVPQRLISHLLPS